MMKNTIRIFTTILILSLLITNVSIAQIGYDNAEGQKLINALVEEGYVTGGSAAVSVNGQILWQGAAGKMNEKDNLASLDETVYRTASIAKCITAVAAMQLVETGKLDLDLPIQMYVSGYPISPLGDITTRHLLNNTSGIAAYGSWKEAQTQEEYQTLTDATKVFEDRPLLFEPGTQYAYSTYGYVVLGRVIEGASKMSYSDYVQQNIFDKVGMKNSGVEQYGESQKNQTVFYQRNHKGRINEVKKVNNLSNRIPGGGFYSTVADMIAFGTAVMDGTLVSLETMENMFTDAGVRDKDAGNPYAKGWFLYGDNPKLGRIIGAGGEQSGCSNQIIILPEMNIVTIIMTNTSGALNQVRPAAVRLLSSLLPEETK